MTTYSPAFAKRILTSALMNGDLLDENVRAACMLAVETRRTTTLAQGRAVIEAIRTTPGWIGPRR